MRHLGLACLVLCCSLIVSAQTGVPVVPERTTACAPIRPLRGDAEQMARQIGVIALVERLRTLSETCDQSGTNTVEQLVLHQRITEHVVSASLDVEAVVGEIDYERAQIAEMRNTLSNARDRQVNLLSMANIVAGTGSGIITNAMQFSNATAKVGDGIGVGGGIAGVFLSVLGLRVRGGKASLGIAPNMLAPLFGRKPELRSIYPEDVWAYLNTAPAADPRIHLPWREELISDWITEKRIGPPDAPASQKRIGLLTSSIAEQKRLSIDVLSDRALMLLDLRSRVMLMNRDLRTLLNSVNELPIGMQ